MDYFQALLFSFVEGVSEFLPISSTGHLILTSKLLNIQETEFVKSFFIYIQLGSIVAVLVLYGKKLLLDRKSWSKVLTAFIPSATVGFIFYKLIKTFFLGNAWITIISLFLGGIAFIVIEKTHSEQDHHKDTLSAISYKQAFFIGLCQAISVIPGVSRSGASILGGMISGLKRRTSVEFSFLLAIPTMIAASTLDVVKTQNVFTQQEWGVVFVGFMGSFFFALLAIRFLLTFIQKHSFILFGVYRILIAILFLLFSTY